MKFKKNLKLIIIVAIVCILLIAGCLEKTSQIDKFLGYWENEDKDTNSITKVDIAKVGNNIVVHIWGKCYPDDCDWGISTTDISDADDGILNLTWIFDFAIETQELSVLSDGRLKVITFVKFHEDDKYQRVDYMYTEYFVKKY